MIHDFEQKYVSPNTAVTEIPHICATFSEESSSEKLASKDRYIELEAEVLWLRQLKEKSDRAQAELLIEIKSLNEKLARLKAQNEVLNNCWLSEQQKHTYAATQARVWAGRAAFKDAELEELRRQIRELESHLNPGEVA